MAASLFACEAKLPRKVEAFAHSHDSAWQHLPDIKCQRGVVPFRGHIRNPNAALTGEEKAAILTLLRKRSKLQTRTT